MITSLKATTEYVGKKKLKPLLLLEDASDFHLPVDVTNNEGSNLESSLKENNYNSVVVGLAPSKSRYEHLNDAFQILLEHPDNLIAVHRGNYLRDEQGKLSFGLGAFVAALEMASGCSHAKIMGKPSVEIFESALQSMNRDENTLVRSNRSIDSNDNSDEKGCSAKREKYDWKNFSLLATASWRIAKGLSTLGLGRRCWFNQRNIVRGTRTSCTRNHHHTTPIHQRENSLFGLLLLRSSTMC